MKSFFAPNLGPKGRWARGLIGLGLLVVAAVLRGESFWLAGLLALAGLFVIFEAIRGWCLARACGIKTKF